MRLEQWQAFKDAAKRRQAPSSRVPVALIVGSPWLPGYAGVSHLDYYLDPELWFNTNLKFAREFPEAIAFPSWWIEYGMATEPSAAGNRIHFWPDQPPGQTAMLARLEDIERLTPVNPETDGLMALILHRYRKQKQRVFAAGYTIPVASARGPLCTASFLRGINELMVDLVENPGGAHKLLDYTTTLTIRWLQAQADTLGTVEGIFILDDVPGLLSRRSYLEFAHPYLKRICDAFPADWVKVYHNDAKIRQFLADLPDTGFDVLNWSYNLDVLEARQQIGGRMCLLGNVNPLEVGARGTPEQVKAASSELLRKTSGRGLMLSMGGGVSAGTPRQNIAAMLAAARQGSIAVDGA